MQLQRLAIFDRCALGTLHAELPSSQTVGSFQTDGASALGTQLASVAAGQSVVATVEGEQILCSAMTVVGSTVTCVIATNGRGYNGTNAATHVLGTAAEMHVTSAHLDRINEHLARFDDDGLLLPIAAVLIILSATQMMVAGDLTAHFTRGRALVYQVSGVWYRGVIEDSAYGAFTTVTLNGSGLPEAGTIAGWGFEMAQSAHAVADIQLVKAAAAEPATNPPSGHCWLYIVANVLYLKASDGTAYPIADHLTVVNLTGDQAVAGVKTFSSIPVLPASDPTIGNQAVRKSYVDAKYAWYPTASGNLKESADTERSSITGGYVKVKEIQLNSHATSLSGAVRVAFDLKYGSAAASGRIYKNGSAVGTERTASNAYQTFTEDISVVAGDLIQLYIYAGGGGSGSAFCRNFRLYYDKTALGDATVITD